MLTAITNFITYVGQMLGIIGETSIPFTTNNGVNVNIELIDIYIFIFIFALAVAVVRIFVMKKISSEIGSVAKRD